VCNNVGNFCASITRPCQSGHQKSLKSVLTATAAGSDLHVECRKGKIHCVFQSLTTENTRAKIMPKLCNFSLKSWFAYSHCIRIVYHVYLDLSTICVAVKVYCFSPKNKMRTKTWQTWMNKMPPHSNITELQYKRSGCLWLERKPNYIHSVQCVVQQRTLHAQPSLRWHVLTTRMLLNTWDSVAVNSLLLLFMLDIITIDR